MVEGLNWFKTQLPLECSKQQALIISISWKLHGFCQRLEFSASNSVLKIKMKNVFVAEYISTLYPETYEITSVWQH